MTEPTVTVGDVSAAADRLDGRVVRTPLLRAPLLDGLVNGRLLVKAECLQQTGSFKIRGALNTMSQVSSAELARGVVAFSTGNHAQGVARAAQLLGCPATIVMPADAPVVKVAATRAYGARIVTYDRSHDSREEIGARVAAESDAVLVKPYDDPRVIAGQGTVGAEIVEQCAALGLEPDLLLCPCGGGGLIAGVATAIRAAWPDVGILAVEPLTHDDTRRSLASGRREHLTGPGSSICDSLLAPTPGEVTFPLNRELLDGGLVVSDDEALGAMATASRQLKIVLEPGGAVALAAVLAGRVDLDGRTAVVVASGGNVDPETFALAIAGPDSPGGRQAQQAPPESSPT
ncbi:MAG: threonine/serine dehydratase [Acidimicrobiales bacterium]